MGNTGSVLAKKYNNSLYHMLSSLFPEYDWLPWMFAKAPKNYWNDVNTRQKYVKYVERELGIKEMSDWYKVTQKVKRIVIIKMTVVKGFSRKN